MIARSFLAPGLPPAANLATAPRGVDFDDGCDYAGAAGTNSVINFVLSRQHPGYPQDGVSRDLSAQLTHFPQPDFPGVLLVGRGFFARYYSPKAL